jgi:SAM-dependent methyltransferase
MVNPMSADPRIPAQVFGEVAEDFDRVRLPYPAELVEDVLEYLGPGDPGRRALEVGAGTGKATLAFATRGLPLVALEPDRAMAAILARKVIDLPRVHIACSKFEEYPRSEHFDLLYCADAWHWIEPQTRWQAAGSAVVPGGALALFWNHDRVDPPAQRQAMLDVFASFAPAIVVDDEPVEHHDLFARWPGNELTGRDEFEKPVGRVYTSHRTMSAADYRTYVSTRSQVRMLARPIRQRVLAALAGVLGDQVSLTVHTVLYLARRSHR